MKIGELARRSGVNASRIRFYEESGLLPPAVRAVNGYREYEARDVKIIDFVERAQRLGFSLREIAAFLNGRERSPRDLIPSLRAKLEEIDTHLREVRARRREIVRLLGEIETT